MKRTARSIIIWLVFILVLFSSACGQAEGSIKTEKEPEGYVFNLLQNQPIEEHPVSLPMEVASEVGLHQLFVQRPAMDEMGTSDDVINAILGSADQVAKLQDEVLRNNLNLETGDQKVNQTLSNQNGYLKMVIQREKSEQAEEGEGFGPEIWGGISVTGLSSYLFSVGTMNDHTNSAILIKHRFSGAIRGFQTGFYNGSVNIHTGMSMDNHLYFDAGQEFMGYSAANNGEYINRMSFIENEWYFTLAALDSDYGYRYITWQENDPSNHAFYAADLGAIFKPYNFPQSQDLWAGLNYFTQSNEISVDIESLTVYEFAGFSDVEIKTLIDNPKTYIFKNDQEKYELGVQLFESEEYYSAYTIFNELVGFDTGSYLAECERLLQTIEITNSHAAGKIVGCRFMNTCLPTRQKRSKALTFPKV